MDTEIVNIEKLNILTEKIIGAAYKVANTLGFGFLEKVYENALLIELKKSGLKVEQQKKLIISYDNQIIGEYFVDLYIEDHVVVELKVAKNIDEAHQAQLLNYLRANDSRIGLIINFGKSKIDIKRMMN